MFKKHLGAIATSILLTGTIVAWSNASQADDVPDDTINVPYSPLNGDVIFASNKDFEPTPAELQVIVASNPATTVPTQTQSITSLNLAPAPPALNGSKTSYDCRNYSAEGLKRPDWVPADSFQAYSCAQQIYVVPIGFLIGIGQMECNFGQSKANDSNRPNLTCRDPNTRNSAKAAGPAQTLPCVADNSNVANGRKCWKGNYVGDWPDIASIKSPPGERGVIGYGIDGDGDGKYNPWSVYDAALTQANQLKAILKSSNGDQFTAARIYNGGTHGNASKTIPYAEGVIVRRDKADVFMGIKF